MGPISTIRWTAFVYVTPNAIALIHAAFDGTPRTTFIANCEWFGVFVILSIVLVIFSSRVAALLLMAIATLSLIVTLGKVLDAVAAPHSWIYQVRAFAVLGLWIGTLILTFKAFQATRAIQRNKKQRLSDTAHVFE